MRSDSTRSRKRSTRAPLVQPQSAGAARFGIPGVLEVDIDDNGFSATTPVGSVRADENGVSVGSTVGGVSVGKTGVTVNSPIGGIDIRNDHIRVETPVGGVTIGADGTVRVTGPDGTEMPLPGTGNTGLPMPTLKLTPMEIPIPVPRFTVQPLDIPLPVPRFTTEPLQLPLSVPGFTHFPTGIAWPFGAGSTFPDVAMTPSPLGPLPIPYPNLTAAAAAFGQFGAFTRWPGNLASAALPAPLPSPEPPALWVPEMRRAVAHTVMLWKAGTHVNGGVVYSVVGVLPAGAIRSDIDFGKTLEARLKAENVPTSLGKVLSKVLAAAWDGWFAKFIGSLFYPAFIAYPGPHAAPMPNIPVPLLAAGVSAGWAELMPTALDQALRSEFTGGIDTETERTFRQLASWLAEKFARFCAQTLVMQVFGEGPVPAYAPWLPVGQVVGGTLSSGRGILVGSDAFADA